MKHDICIRGAGVAGKTLALLLARQRLRVALVDEHAGAPEVRGDESGRDVREDESRRDVRAWALNAASRQLLQGLRCWPQGLHATPVLEMRVHGDGRGSAHFESAALGVEALNWIVDVPALQALLAEAVRYQADIDTVAEAVPAALTVVCEGRASASRAALGVAFDGHRYPHDAIATRLECERPHGQVARQWFTPEGEILALLPMGGEQGRQVALVWSALTPRVPGLLALDDAAFVAEVFALCGGALGAMHAVAPRAAWPLHVGSARRWVGRMPAANAAFHAADADAAARAVPDAAFALVGDAAHAMHPLAGQGLNVALGDVAELARQLAARQGREYWRALSDMRLLRRYERARRADWLRMRLATDGLQVLFSRPEPAVAALRNWGLWAFGRSGPVKAGVARMAMGAAAAASRHAPGHAAAPVHAASAAAGTD